VTEALRRLIEGLPREGWSVSADGELRHERRTRTDRCPTQRCPLEVAGDVSSVFTLSPADVGLAREEFDAVMDAADNHAAKGLSLDVRRALLAHITLKEAA